MPAAIETNATMTNAKKIIIDNGFFFNEVLISLRSDDCNSSFKITPIELRFNMSASQMSFGRSSFPYRTRKIVVEYRPKWSLLSGINHPLSVQRLEEIPNRQPSLMGKSAAISLAI